MEVNLHTTREIRADVKPTVHHGSVKPAGNAGFEAAENLERALAAEPDSRPDAVADAKQLLEARQYPPPQLISRISRLLGENWPISTE